VAAAAADQQVATLADKYERKIAALQHRIEVAGETLDREKSARTAAMTSDLVGGLFSGRKSAVSTSLRRGAAANERVNAAADKLYDLNRGMADLRAELDGEIDEIRAEWEARAADIAPRQIALAKSNVKVTSIGLVWIPVS
jgi:phage host-nuclease inhibitor protein Gam